MTAQRKRNHVRRPWHLWVIAIGMFALYIGGTRDYLLILIDDTEDIQGQFGPEGAVYFTDYPIVLRVIWTVNILGGLIAPILLIARSRLAFSVAVVAAAAHLVLLAVTFVFLDRWQCWAQLPRGSTSESGWLPRSSQGTAGQSEPRTKVSGMEAQVRVAVRILLFDPSKSS